MSKNGSDRFVAGVKLFREGLSKSAPGERRAELSLLFNDLQRSLNDSDPEAASIFAKASQNLSASKRDERHSLPLEAALKAVAG